MKYNVMVVAFVMVALGAFLTWLSLCDNNALDSGQLFVKVFEQDDSRSLKELLSSGYSVNEVLSRSDSSGAMEECCETLLMLACQENAVKCIALLDEMGVDYGFQMPDGRSVLHYSSFLGLATAESVVDKALATGKVGINDVDGRGFTPLMCALKRGNLRLATWMIKKGGELERWIKSGPGKRRSYLVDLVKSPYHVFEFALDGLYQEKTDEVDMSELLLCIDLDSSDWHERIVKLVSKGADLGDWYIGRRLVKNLLTRCRKVDAEKIQSLVELGLPRERVKSMMRLVEREQREVLADYVKKYCCGSDARPGGNDEIGNFNSDYFRLFVFRKDDVDLLEGLLTNGLITSNYYCSIGNFSKGMKCSGLEDCRTLFALACQCNAKKCIGRLATDGLDYGIVFPDRGTILHCLAKTDYELAVDIAAKVIDTKRVSIDDADIYGATPLWYALKSGNVNFAKWLMSHGAELNHWKISAPGERKRYLAEAMRFPFESFVYVLNEVNDELLKSVSFSELLLCVDLHSPECGKRFAMLIDKGATIDDNVGDEIIKKLLDDEILMGDKAVMNALTPDIITMLVESGLPVECLSRAKKFASPRQLRVIEKYLE